MRRWYLGVDRPARDDLGMSRRIFTPCLLACSLLLALSACGNKGPLFLPEEEEVEKQEPRNDDETETE